tara:strand:+ start:803 stop:1090 length:288 start_codon:yes stop_codon:yes gene_type:complete
MNVLLQGSGNRASRSWPIPVISDAAAEVIARPKVHGPQILALKGDIVDVGQLSQKHVLPEHMLVAWKLIDVVPSSAELRSTLELFQALLVELSEG